MSRSLHVAVAQVVWEENTELFSHRIESQVRAAAAVGVDVILFAECVLHGYDDDLTKDSAVRVAETMDGPKCRRVGELSRRYDLTVLAGFLEREEDCVYNSHLIAQPTGSLRVQRKHALTDTERRADLTAGPADREIVTIRGVRTAIAICADIGNKAVHHGLSEAGAEFLFLPTGGGGCIDQMMHESELSGDEGRDRYRRARSAVFAPDAIVEDRRGLGIGFASANALGPVGQRTCHQGHCMIVDNRFVVRAQIPGTTILEHMQDQMVHATLTFQ